VYPSALFSRGPEPHPGAESEQGFQVEFANASVNRFLTVLVLHFSQISLAALRL